MSLSDRLQHAWNAFMNKDPTKEFYSPPGISYAYRPDRVRLTGGNAKTMVTPIYNRIALDVSNIEFKHCRLDENGRFKEEVDSYMNNCLKLEANLDQTARAFLQDVVLSMFDEGVVAIVPTVTDDRPKNEGAYDICEWRTAKILEWKPEYVKVKIYNNITGLKEEIWINKELCAIIENPLYSVINEPNSTMQRLIRKLNLLDVVDEQSGSGKLDLIIQLPYTLKSPSRKDEAEKRRIELESQLADSKLGIGYIDGTEKIVQLNRSLENNLMNQVEYLTSMLYSQLGLTEEILKGTANEQTMLNYYNRTIEPIASAICDELKRKFLTKTARSQNQSIVMFRDPFKLVPINNIAEIADKFTRNEILTSNEIRQIIGMKPSDDPNADRLINSNISQAKERLEGVETKEDELQIQNELNYDHKSGDKDESSIINNVLDELMKDIDDILGKDDDEDDKS